jgi:hypothetical protein
MPASIEEMAVMAEHLAYQLEALSQQARALAVGLRGSGWQPEELDEGLGIGINDADGKELHVGDRVKVVDSGRYGEATAIVKGMGPDLDDGKARVHVALEDGQDDMYTPSTGRVHLIDTEEAVA